MRRSLIKVVAFAAMCGGLGSIAFGQAKVEVKTVAPGGRDVQYVISNTGAHLVAVHRQGSRFVVSVDGVDGPRMDQVVPFQMGTNNTAAPALISDDGKHVAYISRKGSDYTLIDDGKALLTVHPGNNTIRLWFTGPSGKHLAMALENGKTGVMDFWIDGKPQPAFSSYVQPVFSPDGSRWAYVATIDPTQPKTSTLLVVDGKYTGYMAQSPQFTADNKHLLTLAQVKGAVAVLVDGKATVKGQTIRNVIVSPTGSHYAVILSTSMASGGLQYQVMLDGKPVPNASYSDPKVQGKEPIVKFSPDGNHLAVICSEQQGAISYVVYDGKKGQSYDYISDDPFGISPDGSWLAYVAAAGPGLFTVANGIESANPVQNIGKFLFSKDGKHVMYYGSVQNNIYLIFRDGKVIAKIPQMLQYRQELAISPDGSHWVAMTSHGDLIFDGKTLGGVKLSSSDRTVFSPDGKYLAFNGTVGRTAGMFVTDGKTVTQIGPSASASHITFTRDGKHLFWESKQRVGRLFKTVVYVDGKATTAMFDNVSNPFTTSPLCWQVDDAGVLTCLGPKDGEVKRVTITPDPGSTFVPKS